MLVANAECDIRSVEANDVAAQSLDDGTFNFGQHLIQIVDVRRRVEAKELLELMIRRCGNARLTCAADVDWHPVRLLVVDRLEHTLTGVHDLSSLQRAAMKSGDVPQHPPMN